jgi:outer membrane protein assembly factor BamD (BamD/ComL family)
MKLTVLPALFAASIALAFTGCATVPDPALIPQETSILELSQMGQESIDDSNYKAAEIYYQTIIDRYGSDSAALTAAEFEIAHMRMKKKDWVDAKSRLETIIARYEVAGGASLPPEYLVLAKNDLARIPADKSATDKSATGAPTAE